MTFTGVKYKQQSAVSPNQAPSFNPIGKEDLKWSTVAQKPLYSEQMESGVLYFVAPGKAHSERYGIKNGIIGISALYLLEWVGEE